MRSLPVLLFFASSAIAQPAPKAPPVLTVVARITSVVDSEKKLDSATLAPALDAVRTDLDRCAKQAKVKATATLTFEKGTVAIAAPSDAFGACITPPLKKVVVTGAGKVVVVVELAVVERAIGAIISRDTKGALEKFAGMKQAHPGAGRGTGFGAGTGVGDTLGTGTVRGSTGSGRVDGDFVTHGKLDTGKDRPGAASSIKPVTVSLAEVAGNFGGYAAEDIMRVVKSRTGIWRACYQRELNRTPGLAGKVTFKIDIRADGSVQAVTASLDTMRSAAVEHCLKSNLMRLKFSSTGAAASVTLPLTFAPGP